MVCTHKWHGTKNATRLPWTRLGAMHSQATIQQESARHRPEGLTVDEILAAAAAANQPFGPDEVDALIESAINRGPMVRFLPGCHACGGDWHGLPVNGCDGSHQGGL